MSSSENETIKYRNEPGYYILVWVNAYKSIRLHLQSIYPLSGRNGADRELYNTM